MNQSKLSGQTSIRKIILYAVVFSLDTRKRRTKTGSASNVGILFDIRNFLCQRMRHPIFCSFRSQRIIKSNTDGPLTETLNRDHVLFFFIVPKICNINVDRCWQCSRFVCIVLNKVRSKTLIARFHGSFYLQYIKILCDSHASTNIARSITCLWLKKYETLSCIVRYLFWLNDAQTCWLHEWKWKHRSEKIPLKPFIWCK